MGVLRGIIQIHHRRFRTPENPLLGLVIGHFRRVAIQMIIADIENGGRVGIQLMGGFQLETGQLQNVEIGRLSEQIQCGRSDIAADSHAHAAGPGHFTHQSCHRGFSIGAGDGHDGRRCGFGEQINVTADLRAGSGRRRNSGFGDRNARADHQLVEGGEPVCVELAGAHFQLRPLRSEFAQTRWPGAGIGHRNGAAKTHQIAHAGEPGFTEPYDQCATI